MSDFLIKQTLAFINFDKITIYLNRNPALQVFICCLSEINITLIIILMSTPHTRRGQGKLSISMKSKKKKN